MNDFDTKGRGYSPIFLKNYLGQIVFLYFLAKEGVVWRERAAANGEPVQSLFLRELFAKKHGEYDNFFNEVS